MSTWAEQALREQTGGTLRYAERIAKDLLAIPGMTGTGQEVSLQARQAEALASFLMANKDALEARLGELDSSDGDLPRQLLLGEQQSLEVALQFVERTVLVPRSTSSYAAALEAADWLCSEGFLLLLNDDLHDEVLEPLVVVEAQRSPAVWEPSHNLVIPMLFQPNGNTDTVRRNCKRDGLGLSHFSLVCLPAQLARHPESLCLLSHEVGHALDAVHGTSQAMDPELGELPGNGYWRAWMPELVADLTALVLSGEAYLFALDGALQWLPGGGQPSDSIAYPPNRLRRRLVFQALKRMGSSSRDLTSLADSWGEPSAGSVEAQLEDEFLEHVLEPLLDALCWHEEAWNREQAWIREAADRVCETSSTALPQGGPIRLLPSALLLAKIQQPKLDTAKTLERLLHDLTEKPEWVRSPASWQFTSKLLPSLRSTRVAADGTLKVPPVELMACHNRLAFVGATHEQLLASLQSARERRDAPWQSVEIYFASEELLGRVARVQGGPLPGNGEAYAALLQVRDQAQQELMAFLTEGVVESCSLYHYDGPPVFGAYFDWDKPGGRVHVSTQLLGTDLRHCPSVDHVWIDASPSRHYAQLVLHLNKLSDRAQPVGSG